MSVSHSVSLLPTEAHKSPHSHHHVLLLGGLTIIITIMVTMAAGQVYGMCRIQMLEMHVADLQTKLREMETEHVTDSGVHLRQTSPDVKWMRNDKKQILTTETELGAEEYIDHGDHGDGIVSRSIHDNQRVRRAARGSKPRRRHGSSNTSAESEGQTQTMSKKNIRKLCRTTAIKKATEIWNSKIPVFQEQMYKDVIKNCTEQTSLQTQGLYLAMGVRAAYRKVLDMNQDQALTVASGTLMNGVLKPTRDEAYRFWEEMGSNGDGLKLVERTGRVIVMRSGVYLLYAQVLYHDDGPRTAYAIQRVDGPNNKTLVKCLATSSTIAGSYGAPFPGGNDVQHDGYHMCTNTLVTALSAGQQLQVTSLYVDQAIIPDPTTTFWGIVKLGNVR